MTAKNPRPIGRGVDSVSQKGSERLLLSSLLCSSLALHVGDDDSAGSVTGDVQHGTAHVEDPVHTGNQGDAFHRQTHRGQNHGQQIDVDVFTDPDTGISYLYWGNGYMAGAELNNDMISLKEGSVTLMTPQGGTLQDYAFREAPYVFKRNGLYYFLWSVDDTGSPNYHVAYGTSTSPLGPIKVADEPVILIQRPEEEIYGPAHNSVLQIPGKDEWYIVYHRHPIGSTDGNNRVTCIDRMYFEEDGTIRPVKMTFEGVEAIPVSK